MHLLELVFGGITDGYIGLFFLHRPDKRQAVQIALPDIQGAIDLSKRYAEDQFDAYFSPAVLDRKPESGRRGDKRLYRGSQCLWVDVDSSETRSKSSIIAELDQYPLRPSVVIDSGHGVHAYWMLNDFETDCARIERCNLWLAEEFKADHCHSIDHLLRVPDTLNWKGVVSA